MSADVQFAAANSEELGVKCVPSLNLVYTEEEGYVTADVAEEKSLVRRPTLHDVLQLLYTLVY